MPISGTTHALMQARLGIARMGATRLGYFYPNLIIKVAGTDITRQVVEGSLVIEDELHEQPNKCTFEVFDPTTPPAADDAVIVASGCDQDGLRDFVGVVANVRQMKPLKGQTSRYEVDCTEDASWEINRLLITQSWVSTSATDIVLDIMAASGSSIGTGAVQTGLATVTAFSCENQKTDSALTDLAMQIGARWYVEDDVLHFFTSETVQQALALTDSATHFWGLTYTTDQKELCTRAIAEGQSHEVMIDVPAGSTTVPIQVGWGFAILGEYFWLLDGYVRFSGSAAFVQMYKAASHLIGPPAAVVATDTAIGATSIELTTTIAAGFGETVWAHDSGGNLFSYTGSATGPDRLTGIPASGYGSITAAIPAGTPIYGQDYLDLGAGTPVDLKAGDVATFRAVKDDAGAQATYGIREALVSMRVDESSPYGDEVHAVAQAHLDAYKSPITRIRYFTRERHAKSGRTVDVTLTDPNISATFKIQRVTIRYERLGATTAGSGRAFPIREVEAAPQRYLTITDLLARVA